MDNCCYNRPYDNQSQIRIQLESQAKLYIQDQIRLHKIELVTSYVLDYENDNNRSIQKKTLISRFMKEYSSFYVSNLREPEIRQIASSIMQTGVKEKDAYHVACAVLAECDYFISTDDRLLKYHSDMIALVSPGEFIRRTEGNHL